MDAESITRRLRGAIGTAALWGAGWATLGFAAFAALKVTGNLGDSVRWIDSILVAARFGFIGGIVGSAFSACVGLLYGGRRLSDIRALRFGIGGGIMAGLFVPGFCPKKKIASHSSKSASTDVPTGDPITFFSATEVVS